MDTSHNLYANVFSGAGSYPDRIAFRTLDKSLTYGELQERVVQAAIAFRENGVDAHSCVAVDTRKSLPSLTAALAFALLGCKWVFASRDALNNPLLFITHLVQDGSYHLASSYKTLIMDEAWHNGRVTESDLSNPSIAGRVEPARILVVGQSSGTTGEPKFFPITAENSIRRINPKYLLDPSPLPVVVSMFNLLHAGIYFVLLRVLAKGGTILIGLDKSRWHDAGLTMLLASPMHVARILEGKANGKIPRLWLAGSPIYPAFLDKALRHFDVVLNAYGAIEAGIVCYQAIKDRAAEGDMIGVGSALDGIVLQVVDEVGQSVKVGDVGEVRYQSPMLTTGYIGDSAATRTFFRDGWFYPGDTGYLNAKRQLFITGRVNDLLNIGGTKLNAASVDDVIQSTPGITDGVCFTELGPSGFEQLSVVIVTKSVVGSVKVLGELQKKLAARFARDLIPHSIYIAETIPRNENGKVLRSMARQKAQSGVWHQVTLAKE